MSKPLVFCYKDYTDLKAKYEDLLYKYAHLKGEKTNLEIKCRILEADKPSAAVHKPDYSYEADMVRRLKETLSANATIGDYPNDLISRSALMEYCSNQKSKSIDNNDIARFPSADAVQGWRTGKPTKQGEYTVTVKSMRGGMVESLYYGKPIMPNRKVKGKCWYRSDDEWGDVVYDDTDILAWQPLPKPYKGGDDE